MISTSLQIVTPDRASLVVMWSHIRNQPDDEDLYQYYSYYVEYRALGSSDWIRDILPYNPDDDPPQATIDGLTSHTEYQVRILGVRSKGTQTDEETADKTKTKTFTTLFGRPLSMQLHFCSYLAPHIIVFFPSYQHYIELRCYIVKLLSFLQILSYYIAKIITCVIDYFMFKMAHKLYILYCFIFVFIHQQYKRTFLKR